MARLFISYAREDRDAAQGLAHALEEAGFYVWWDRQIPGGTDFTQVITENLAAARLVLVLWSENAVQSAFVRDESARALREGKLLPVRIDEVDPPWDSVRSIPWTCWTGTGMPRTRAFKPCWRRYAGPWQAVRRRRRHARPAAGVGAP
jgi:adenylate cyclase